MVDLELSEPLTVFDYAVEWVLAAALIFAPIPFGTTNAWSQQILYALAALLALILAAKLILVHGTKIAWTWSYLPVALYIGLITLSVIPLPAGLVSAISPGTLQEKQRLLSDIPNFSALLSRITISFYVWSTEQGLRLILAVSAVFVVIVNIYRTSAQIQRLLFTVALAGAAIAVLALVQDITHVNGQPFKIYWSVDAVHPNSGPFAVHSQLGQYLNLAIGAMLALAFVLIGEIFTGEDPNGREIVEKFNTLQLRLAVLLGLFALAGAAAIGWSATRGGVIASGFACVLVFVLLFVKRGWRGRESKIFIAGAIVLALVLAVGYVLIKPQVHRLNGTAEESARGRLGILHNIPPMVKQWPVMGSGLESFAWVYPMFDHHAASSNLYEHADNEYAQTLSDTGLIGGFIVAAFVAIMFVAWVRAFRGRQPLQLATIGIAFSISAVMIHSISDYSQRTPAIALETSVLLGLILCLARTATPATAHHTEKPTFGWSPLPGVALLVVLITPMAWCLWSLNAVRLAEDVPPLESDPNAFSLNAKPTDADYAERLHDYFAEPIEWDQKACALDPDNVLYVHWLNHFRYREMAGIHDLKTTAVIYPAEAARTAQQIIDEISAARVLAPTYGKLYTLLGKIQWDLLDKAAGEKNLKIGHELRPGDGETLFYLAQVAAERGNWSDASKWATLCFVVDFRFEGQLIDVFLRQYPHPEVAFDAMKDRGYSLNRLANALGQAPEYKPLLQKINEQQFVIAKRDTIENPGDGNAWASLGYLLENHGEHDAAIDAYRNALNVDYTNVDWRISLARVLATIGRVDEAQKEAETCLRIRPQMDEAKGLLASLASAPPRPSK